MSLPRISLRKIACFVAAADEGSVSAGARRLCLSQAAMSEALNDLEKELGLDLFIRHKAIGVTLTGAGRQLLVEARRLVRQAEEFHALAGGPAAGLVRRAGRRLLPDPPAVPRAVAAGRISRPASQRDAALHRGFAAQSRARDAGGKHRPVDRLRPRTSAPASNACGFMTQTPISLFRRDIGSATRRRRSTSRLFGDDPFIQIDVLPGRNDHLFAAIGITPNIVHRTTNFEFVRALVAHNLGYAVLVQRPRIDITYEGLPVVVRPIANPVPPLTVCPRLAVQPASASPGEGVRRLHREGLPRRPARLSRRLG